jgi:hypothetical protein
MHLRNLTVLAAIVLALSASACGGVRPRAPDVPSAPAGRTNIDTESLTGINRQRSARCRQAQAREHSQYGYGSSDDESPLC